MDKIRGREIRRANKLAKRHAKEAAQWLAARDARKKRPKRMSKGRWKVKQLKSIRYKFSKLQGEKLEDGSATQGIEAWGDNKDLTDLIALDCEKVKVGRGYHGGAVGR